jgi:hypothetical protein
MSGPAKKKRIPCKAISRKKLQPAKKAKQDDSEAIERAVYDGMQDLRADKPG